MVDVVLGTGQFRGMGGEDVPENVAGSDMGDVLGDRPEERRHLRIGNEAIPEAVVLVDVVLEVGVDHRAVVAPRVAAE
ncbi:hypothetical protein D3C87_1390780 [compost metagenome]